MMHSAHDVYRRKPDPHPLTCRQAPPLSLRTEDHARHRFDVVGTAVTGSPIGPVEAKLVWFLQARGAWNRKRVPTGPSSRISLTHLLCFVVSAAQEAAQEKVVCPGFPSRRFLMNAAPAFPSRTYHVGEC